MQSQCQRSNGLSVFPWNCALVALRHTQNMTIGAIGQRIAGVSRPKCKSNGTHCPTRSYVLVAHSRLVSNKDGQNVPAPWRWSKFIFISHMLRTYSQVSGNPQCGILYTVNVRKQHEGELNIKLAVNRYNGSEFSFLMLSGGINELKDCMHTVLLNNAFQANVCLPNYHLIKAIGRSPGGHYLNYF